MSGHALRDWRLIAGHENVVTDPAVISKAEVATFATSARIMAILRPANAGEAAACMTAAHRHGIDVHPVSRGLNWGLGSKTPAVSGAAVMELHRFDRIVGFDESFAFVTVEPGVTFRQLDAFLKARGSSLFLPAIGGSPDASIIGNAIQRGHGIGPSSRRADAIGSMEVVLRDGTVASTGYLPGSIFTGGETHRHGAGPSLAGLFQQGFMGIVTRMTLTLERTPELLVPFYGRTGTAAALGDLLEKLRPMLMEGCFGRHVFTFWNPCKQLACGGRYPWDEMAGATPLDLDRIGETDDWRLSGALYAPTAAHAAAAIHSLHELRGVIPELEVLDPAGHEAKSVSPAFLGVPREKNLTSMGWRKKGPLSSPPQPEADRCGVLQACLLLPFGAAAVPLLARIEAIATAHGLEAQIGFDGDDPRCIESFVTLCYDRDIPGADENAMACHEALAAGMNAMGCLPYRLGTQAAGQALPGDPGRQVLVDRIRGAL